MGLCCGTSGEFTAAGNKLGDAWIGGKVEALILGLGFLLISE